MNLVELTKAYTEINSQIFNLTRDIYNGNIDVKEAGVFMGVIKTEMNAACTCGKIFAQVLNGEKSKSYACAEKLYAATEIAYGELEQCFADTFGMIKD